jgi:hypothetical protein
MGKFFRTLRADAMGKLRFGMVPDIRLDSTPVSFIIADFFTPGANGK